MTTRSSGAIWLSSSLRLGRIQILVSVVDVILLGKKPISYYEQMYWSGFVGFDHGCGYLLHSNAYHGNLICLVLGSHLLQPLSLGSIFSCARKWSVGAFRGRHLGFTRLIFVGVFPLV